MTLQQLKYVTMVAEKGSLSAACKLLFISQPSLTKAIKELENEIQIKIFDRTNKGVIISKEGNEFLGYARQVLMQNNLLEEKYLGKRKAKVKFSVSAQHYSFAVNAFAMMVKTYEKDKYDFTLRETMTNEIIMDVDSLVSEVGILYLSNENEKIIMKILKKKDLEFKELFIAKPHVFISSKHPLANKDIITMEDLKIYPYLSFEQGDHNSFYFSEEILSSFEKDKNIMVRDRATLFNLLIGVNGYTISSGIISKELNGENIIAKPLKVNEVMRIGTITKKHMILSKYAISYLEFLRKYISLYK